MRIPRAVFAAGFLLSTTLSACGSDGGNGPGNAIEATWNVTSFVVMGVDAIANGMTFQMDLSAGDSYTFDITNDMIDACTPNADCTVTGSYSHTGSTITIDPGTPDEVTLNYTLQGTTMTLTGSISGTPVTITLTKV